MVFSRVGGTLSALKEIFTKGLFKHRYIYDCDLKDYFNRISLSSLRGKLISLNVPPLNIVNYLYELNPSTPKLPSVQHSDENRIKEKEDYVNKC